MITETDLMIELRRLHEEHHLERQPGEFTVAEYAKANGLTNGKAGNELAWMLKTGRVEKPPKKYIHSRFMVVYKITAN